MKLLFVAGLAALCCSSWAQVVIGDCNVVFNNVKVTGGQSVRVGDIGCPQDPKKVLRVGYYWLDANSASFLFHGVVHGALRDLVGGRPFVVHNSVQKALSELLDQFTEPAELGGGYYYSASVGSRSRTVDGNRFDSETLSKTMLGRVRTYTGERLIYDFDAALVSAYLGKVEVPDGYSAYMTTLASINGTTATVDASDAFDGMVLWRHLDRSQLESYRARMIAERDRLLAQKDVVAAAESLSQYLRFELTNQEYERIGRASIGDTAKEERLRAIATIRRLPDNALNKAIAAALYITRAGWPLDFMQQLGYWEGHAGSLTNWETAIPSRRLFVQVAIVENSGGAGAVYALTGFRTSRSVSTQLRTIDADTEEVKEVQPFAPARIGPGDRVVVPLRIALRPNFEVGFATAPRSLMPSKSGTNALASSLRAISPGTILAKTAIVDQRGKKATLARKRAGDLLQRLSLPAPRTYLWGPRVTLESFEVDGRSVPARPFDPNNVFMVAGYEGGSCPILYVKRAGEVEAARIGPLLRAAHGRAMEETIDLGSAVSEITLAEEEPETSTISTLQVLRRRVDGTTEVQYELPREAVLHYGQALSIALPTPEAGDTYTLRLVGRYETHNAVALRQHTTSTKLLSP